MNTQLTIRLPDTLAQDIAMLAGKLHLKRSDIVRVALERFVREAAGEEESIPYNRVQNLIGSVSSGVSDLGEAHREHLVKRFKRRA